MAENKTRPTGAPVDAFLEAVADLRQREDAKALRAMMERVTGEPAAMWGPGIVGFGAYHYKYESGREGDSCRLGFSPRAKELVLYVGAGALGEAALTAPLGRHRIGKGCLYVKRLADVDPAALEALLADALRRSRDAYPD